MPDRASVDVGGDLRLTGVTKRFSAFTAVDGIDLTIAQGEFFALLGPSGCGKTTTLRMIAGLEEPTEGTIHLGDLDVTHKKPYQRPVNTVFQNYALFPHLTVFENVAFGLRRRGVKDVRKQAADALDLVELGHLAQRKPAQLSGGQQQRIALARAVVNRPQVLLLDEPLGALDLKLRRQMQIELKRIQTEVGITFVHVTHDQEEAMTMADRVAVMNHGKIEQLGVRPEKIRILAAGSPDAPEGLNVFTGGVVLDASYMGVSTQYLVRLPWGQNLTVFSQNLGIGERFADGAQVLLAWEPDHSFGLAGDAAAGVDEDAAELATLASAAKG